MKVSCCWESLTFSCSAVAAITVHTNYPVLHLMFIRNQTLLPLPETYQGFTSQVAQVLSLHRPNWLVKFNRYWIWILFSLSWSELTKNWNSPHKNGLILSHQFLSPVLRLFSLFLTTISVPSTRCDWVGIDGFKEKFFFSLLSFSLSVLKSPSSLIRKHVFPCTEGASLVICSACNK